MLASSFRASVAIALLLAPVGACSWAVSEGAAPAIAQKDDLQFTGYVVDQGGMFPDKQRRALTKQLGDFQRATHHQLVVVTVKSLSGEDVGAFTTKLANRWGVGRSGFNDGIVLLVAPLERKARIAVGHGLEAELPDVFCADVMHNQMVPQFAKGDIVRGVQAGVSAIIERLSLEHVTAAEHK